MATAATLGIGDGAGGVCEAAVERAAEGENQMTAMRGRLRWRLDRWRCDRSGELVAVVEKLLRAGHEAMQPTLRINANNLSEETDRVGTQAELVQQAGARACAMAWTAHAQPTCMLAHMLIM